MQKSGGKVAVIHRSFMIFVVFCGLLMTSVALAHSPHDDAEVIAISPQFEYDQTIFCAFYARSNYLIKSVDGGNSWVPSQIGLSPEQIKDLAISPGYYNDQTIFAGSNGDGVYRTTDGGGIWTKIDVGLFDLEVTKLAISPRFDQDGIIFAGTKSGQIFLSSNGGDNWIVRSSGLPGVEISTLAISPTYSDQDKILYAGTATDGVYVSANAGMSWNQINTGLIDLEVTTLAISNDYATDKTLFVGTLTQGVFKSTSGGLTWDTFNSGINDFRVVRLVVSPLFGTDQTVFCVSNDTGAYKSTDGGNSWTLYEEGFEYRAPQTELHFKGVAFSPNYVDDRIVFVWMFEGLFKSKNRGQNYFQLNIYPQTIVRSMVVSPDFASDGTVFAATNGGGVYRSMDNGTTWETKNTGLTFRFLSPIDISPDFANDDMVWTGTLNYVNTSTDRGDRWIPIKGDTSGNYFLSRSLGVSPDFANDGTVYTGNLFRGLHALYRSTNRGLSYQPVDVEVNSVAVIAFSPNFGSDGIMYIGTNVGVLRSTDSGANFLLSSDEVNVEWMVVSPDFSNDYTVFMGEHFGGVYKSTNGGNSWLETNTGLPDNVALTQIAISDGYATDQTVLISTVSSGVFVSTDGGANWTYSGLEGNYLRSLAASSNYSQDGIVFAGGWDGVHRMALGGGWSRVLNMTRYEESSDLVLVKGTWKGYAIEFASERDVYYSAETGNSLTLSFVGTSVDWLGSKAKNLGIAAVYVDDVFLATVDQYDEETKWQEVLYSVQGLTPGLHRMKISVTGMANANATGQYVVVDAFEVINP